MRPPLATVNTAIPFAKAPAVPALAETPAATAIALAPASLKSRIV